MSAHGRASTEAALSLGANLARREETILAAVARLAAAPRIRLISLSSLYETSPVGMETARIFMNAACLVETTLSPRGLLTLCGRIESEFGRRRQCTLADRTLDIDIILYGDIVIDDPALVIPHPRLDVRRFVLEPLAEIAPGMRIPPSGESISDLLHLLEEEGWVRRVSSRRRID